MKINIGLLLGGLVLLLVSTASAGTVLCGSLGSAGHGDVTFTTSANGPGGTADFNTSTITCTAFTVPAGQTLTSISFAVTDDANQSIDSNSQITWTWAYTGSQGLAPVPGASNVEQGNGLGAFGNCQSGGTLGCNALASFTPTTALNGGDMTGTLSFMVTPVVTGPTGLGPTGADSAQLSVSFTYVPTATIPEPTALILIGSGLIGLGVFARRKRQS